MVRNLFLFVLLAVTACSTMDTQQAFLNTRIPATERKDPTQAKTLKDLSEDADPGSVTIFQVNDVYEVEASESGTRGGLARIATLRRALDLISPPAKSTSRVPNPQRVISVLPGDFISPSAIGASIEIKNGKHVYEPGTNIPVRVAGRHMVEGLRRAGVDIVSFGNHEFDPKNSNPKTPEVPPTALADRIREFTSERPHLGNPKGGFPYGTLAKPQWLAGNVQLKTPTPLPGLEDSHNPYIWETMVTVAGKLVPVKVAFITVCIPTWTSAYANFEGNDPNAVKKTSDVFASAKRQIDFLEGKGVDAIIALTHQSMENDRLFAEKFHEKVHLIAGGHEHDRQFESFKITKERALHIAKADANAKSAYIHRLHFAQNNLGKVALLKVSSKWIEVDSQIPDDKLVKKITSQSEVQAKDSFRLLEFTETHRYAPDRVAWTTVNGLDGRESKIRSQKTHLSELIGRSITARAYRDQKRQGKGPSEFVVGAIYHGGTIRIDDQLMSGPELSGLLSRSLFESQVEACKDPKNCIPTKQDPSRCEKRVRCPGDITEYDALRVAPFEGTSLTWMGLTGKQILRLYTCNDQNSGTGSYLHFSNFFPCANNRSLCYRAPDTNAAELSLAEQETPVALDNLYWVASLDYFSHKALSKNHPEYGKIGVVPPMYPSKDEYNNSEFMKGWIRAHDVRRAIVEEATVRGSWPQAIATDPKVGERPGYGPQPPLEGKLKKDENCIYF